MNIKQFVRFALKEERWLKMIHYNIPEFQPLMTLKFEVGHDEKIQMIKPDISEFKKEIITYLKESSAQEKPFYIFSVNKNPIKNEFEIDVFLNVNPNITKISPCFFAYLYRLLLVNLEIFLSKNKNITLYYPDLFYHPLQQKIGTHENLTIEEFKSRFMIIMQWVYYWRSHNELFNQLRKEIEQIDKSIIETYVKF